MLKILLLCNDPVTLALMRASADALKGVLDAFDDAADLQRKLNKGTNGLPVAVVLDLAALAARGIRLANACTRVRQTLPDAKIGVIASATHWVDDVIVEWAREAGADYAVAQINPWRWNMTGERLLNELIGDRDTVDAAMRRITPYVRAAAQTTSGGAQARVIAAAEAYGIDLSGFLGFLTNHLGAEPDLPALAAVLRQLKAEGMSLLLVEHDMDFVMGLTDRIVVMEFGTKLIEGTPTEVQASPVVSHLQSIAAWDARRAVAVGTRRVTRPSCSSGCAAGTWSCASRRARRRPMSGAGRVQR